MIILTAEEADKVRGVPVKGHALAPRPLSDGTLALPETVLSDAAHAIHHAFLATLPTRKVVDDEYVGFRAGRGAERTPLSAEESATLHKYAYKADWPVGVVIALEG